jgi:hypothetical protein
LLVRVLSSLEYWFLLTIFIGDGLRADLLFNINAFSDIPGSPEIVAPYLRSIVEERGAFGISHTRVPTESRPGHVAIIGKISRNLTNHADIHLFIQVGCTRTSLLLRRYWMFHGRFRLEYALADSI